MSDLGRGASDLGRGFAFLGEHKRLWGYVIAPALVSLAILVAIGFGVFHLIDPAVAWVVGKLPGFLQSIVGSLVWLLVLFVLGFGVLLVFVAVVGIVAGPFNEMLSEAVEAVRTGRSSPTFAVGRFARDFVRGLAHGLRRLATALLGALLLFALGFIPVLGSLAALALGFYFTARASAYDCYDAVLARQGLGYDAKVAYLAQRRSRTLGLGAAVAGCLFVPGVNLVALGVGATGATLVWLDEAGPRRPSLGAGAAEAGHRA